MLMQAGNAFLISCMIVHMASHRVAWAQESNTPDREQHDIAEMKMIAQGYLHNQESFPFFSCRFVITQGSAPSLKEAVERGPASRKEQVEGVWVVDGDRVRYERRGVGKHGHSFEDGRLSVALPPLIYLEKKPLALSLDFVLGGGGIYSPEVPSPGVQMTPWDAVGAISSGQSATLAGVIATCVANPSLVKTTLTDDVNIDGVLLTRLDVDYGSYRLVFFVDPKRGYLPVQTWYETPSGSKTKCFLTEIRECSGKRWFPMRCVAVWLSADGAPLPDSVREFRTIELEADRRPESAAFVAVLPTKMQVHDCNRPNSAIAVPAGRRVHVDDLESLVTECAAASEIPMEVEDGSKTWRWVLAVNTVVIILVFTLIVVRRHRRLKAA